MRPIVGLLAAWLAALPLHAEPLQFGLFGDTPYSEGERKQLSRMMASMDRENLAFSVHLGDIKNGRSECSDEVFSDILALFQKGRTPLVYVPGDNEWTDCHRKNNGGYDPLERLNKLRHSFFVNDTALGINGARLRLQRQSSDPAFAAYRENVRWEMGGAIFVGMNVTGSDNAIIDPERPSVEYLERAKANRTWLQAAFAHARAKTSRGILIAIQANPKFQSFNLGHPNPGYREFLEQLVDETRRFSGQVVLAHGDTHVMRIDHPLNDPVTGEPLTNFTRVETYGAPFMGWVRGSVDAALSQVFRFEPQSWRQRQP